MAESMRAAERERASTFDRQTLETLKVRQRQQQEAAGSSKVFHAFQFTNRVQASGISFVHVTVDDAGRDYKAIHYDHGNGMAVADIDGDGLTDLYFTTQLGTNHLYKNLGGGRFANITGEGGVGLANQLSVAASFADVDNDGDPDLFVTTVRFGNHLFENQGQGRFRDVTQPSGLSYSGHSSGAVFFDFDRDGLLDLFLANVGRYTSDQRGRGGYYIGTTNGFVGHLDPAMTEYSILYRNAGAGKFKDVSQETGLRDGSWSGDATAADLNQDGFPDLYVLNMQGDDHYYENQGGKRFVDRTAALFPKTPWGTMGVKCFDANRDGWLDLLLTDMHSDMTPGQNKQTGLERMDLEKAKSEAFCMAQFSDAFLQGASNNIFGNAFFLNQGQGQGRFTELSGPMGLETYWPWGLSVGDVNADGYDDVFVTAGMGYPYRYAINSLLLNENGKRFIDSEFLVGIEPRQGEIFSRKWFVLDCAGEDKLNPQCKGRTGLVTVGGTLSSRSSAMIDLDNDGDLDIVTADFNDRPQVLMSDLSAKKSMHFLKVKLVGAKSNRDGLGALVKVTAGGATSTQPYDGKSGYLSQSSIPLYFGLGETPSVERVEVLWPSGTKQVITENIPSNQVLTVKEAGL